MELLARWDRHSAGYQAGAQLSTDVARYGPDIPTENELGLLGHLRSGSSVKEMWGSSGVRRRRAIRSSRPPNGSTWVVSAPRLLRPSHCSAEHHAADGERARAAAAMGFQGCSTDGE